MNQQLTDLLSQISSENTDTKLYDSEHQLTYGYFRCTVCNCEFYGGGDAIHGKKCLSKTEGYKSCVYVFGPNENTKWIGAQITQEELLLAKQVHDDSV